MNIYIITVILFGVYGLFHFVIAKSIRKKAVKNTAQKIRNEAVAVVINRLSDFALFAGVVYSVCIAVIWICRLLGITMSGYTFKSMVNFIEGIGNFIGPIGGIIGSVLFFIALFTFVFIVYRGVVVRYSTESQKIREDLINQLLCGNLPELDPTIEMTEVSEKITELESFLYEQGRPESSDHVISEQHLDQVREAIKAFKSYYLNLDIERRINLQFENSRSNSWKESLLTFFSSKGLIDSLSAVGGWLGKVAFAVLLLSLLSIQIKHVSHFGSETLSYEAQRTSLADARNEFDQLIQGGKPYTLTPEDESILDELARDFELGFASNAFWEEMGPSADTSFLMRSLVVREKILESFISLSEERHNSDSFGTYPSLADGDFHGIDEFTWESSNSGFDSGDSYRALVVDYHLNKSSGHSGPQTSLGREFREKLKSEVAQKSARHWESIKSKVADFNSSFSKPASLKSVSGMLFSDVAGDMTGDITKFNNSNMSSTADKLIKGIGKGNVKVINDNIIYRYMNKLVSPTPYADAWNDIKNMSTTDLFPNEKTARLIKQEFPNLTNVEISNMADNHPPGLKANTRPVNQAKVTRILDKITSTHDRHEPLSTFDNFFPAQNPDYTKPRYETRPGERGRIAVAQGDWHQPNSRGRTNFTRARSYGQLKGFSRIGGVLIGNAPISDVTLDIDDITWTERGDQMNLVFSTNGGEKVQFGPYPTAIVQQALV